MKCFVTLKNTFLSNTVEQSGFFLRFPLNKNYKVQNVTDIHKKNSSVKVAETSYVHVSRGSLSIGEIKFWGKAARGKV